jgi:hypothetical protein
MEDTKPNNNGLSAEQLEKIGGGDCSPADYITLVGNLTQAYEGLVDFTSHVIERVLTSKS